MMSIEQQIREEICEIGRRIYENGMVAANDGNISVRLNEHEIICTPTGISKGYMTPECLCKIDEAGNVIEAEGGYRPSSETKMHLMVYQMRDDVKAVVHAHPAYATTYAVGGQALNKAIISESIVSLGCVPLAEYGLPSTQEIPDAIKAFLPYFDCMLLEHHGVLTYGTSLTESYYRMESVELYARLMYQTKLAGMDRELPAEVVHRLCKMREDAGMRNPEQVCRSKRVMFACCKDCSRLYTE